MASLTRIIYDDEFGIVLLRKSGRSRGLSIRVRTRPTREGARVTVSMPVPAPFQAGVSYLESKRDWIRRALASQDARTEKAVGEGRAQEPVRDGLLISTLSCRILFRADAALQNKALISNGMDDEGNPLRTISFPSSWTDGSGNVTDVAIEKWLGEVLADVLRQEAKAYLPARLEMLACRFGFKYAKVFIKHNLTNWGSCSSKGNINLNLNLLRLPEYLADYVILHELCHLREPNHGPGFHALLGRILTEHFNIAPHPDDSGFEEAFSAGEVEHWLRKEISRWRLM